MALTEREFHELGRLVQIRAEVRRPGHFLQGFRETEVGRRAVRRVSSQDQERFDLPFERSCGEFAERTAVGGGRRVDRMQVDGLSEIAQHLVHPEYERMHFGGLVSSRDDETLSSVGFEIVGDRTDLGVT